MSRAITHGHAIDLRSHVLNLRLMLAIAAIAIVGLTVAVVILASDESASPSAQVSSAGPASVVAPAGTTRFDGGPEEGTRGLTAASAPSTTRFDGGPEEGTRGVIAASAPSTTRFDGGPEEGTRGLGR